MRVVLLSFVLFFFIACENKQETQFQSKDDENVTLEQNDEKSEVNDSNVPLPVQDDFMQNQKPQSKLLFSKHFKQS